MGHSSMLRSTVKMNTIDVQVDETNLAGTAKDRGNAKWWYIGTGAALAAGLTTYFLLAEDASRTGAVNTYELDIINGDGP